jgi:hypothetical protein
MFDFNIELENKKNLDSYMGTNRDVHTLINRGI